MLQFPLRHQVTGLSLLSICLLVSSFQQGVSQEPASSPDSTAIIHLPPFFTPSDSIWYQYGSSTGVFLLSSVKEDTDITELPDSSDFVLFSRTDTIAIHCTPQPTHLFLISPQDTVYEIVYYGNRKLELLREYTDFEIGTASGAPHFYYSAPSDSNLTQLRRTYALDSVANSGSEVERIIALMGWAHSIVRHDGNSENPKPRNALHLIEVCRQENRGVNCRMMATILNEAYLALGFRSRHVACMPYDRNDSDCHVINMVYSETLGKWLYMDPTFQAYWMDADSTLLGIAEVREKMIRGEPLLLSEGINWNGAPHDPAAYRRYIEKNLFRFNCPVGSEFGYETREGKREWIYLDPSGYNTNESAVTADSAGNWVDYTIHDAAWFWEKP